MPPLPRLPIPDLNETCERYLKQVRPLLTNEEYKKTVAATRYFKSARGKGPELQAALQKFDNKAEKSWLIDAWLESYLKIRTPLPLTSNVGFTVQTFDKGLAEWTAALASVCADYRHNRIPTPKTPQDTPVCMEQWKILQGACRVPCRGTDRYHFAPQGGRHIGILHNGFYYRITALDEQFEAYHPDTFKQAFGQILTDSDKNPFPVAVPCYLGGDETAAVYEALRSEADNAELVKYIENDLFHISINQEDLDADADLTLATFVPQQNVWCYKPTTYCYNTVTRRLFLHCEHAWEDGGALKGIVVRAAEHLNKPAGKTIQPAVNRYQWQLDETLQQNWAQWQKNYAARAAKMSVLSITVPFNGYKIPEGISQDALMQFLLQYAQLSTYGDVRNTYEAVDVSHFQSGRTECVRPISDESLAFVTGLLREQPNKEALSAALAEHKARIKTAKQGLGANRHLLGLQLMVPEVCSRVPTFFRNEGYKIFTTDFLSTSTLGDDTNTLNFAFAPTSAGGLGINYTITCEGWLFTVSHLSSQKQEAGIFLESVKQGGERLLTFLNSKIKE